MSSDELHKNNENNLSMKNAKGDTEERTLSLLKKIQSGLMDSKCIRPVERRLIVRFLMVDGNSTADIAQVLNVFERTIERDKKTIRESDAITQNIGQVPEFSKIEHEYKRLKHISGESKETNTQIREIPVKLNKKYIFQNEPIC